MGMFVISQQYTNNDMNVYKKKAVSTRDLIRKYSLENEHLKLCVGQLGTIIDVLHRVYGLCHSGLVNRSRARDPISFRLDPIHPQTLRSISFSTAFVRFLWSLLDFLAPVFFTSSLLASRSFSLSSLTLCFCIPKLCAPAISASSTGELQVELDKIGFNSLLSASLCRLSRCTSASRTSVYRQIPLFASASFKVYRQIPPSTILAIKKSYVPRKPRKATIMMINLWNALRCEPDKDGGMRAAIAILAVYLVALGSGSSKAPMV
ncbi:hypothetical protein LXL04_019045 [Taraxacum kok-saghyz]